MHDAKAHDIGDNKVVDGDDGDDEEDDNDEEEDGNDGDDGDEVGEDDDGSDDTVRPSTDVQPCETAASTDVVTSRKRKASPQDGNAAKKAQSSTSFTIAGGVVARSIAGMKRKRTPSTVDAALSKQEVGDAEVTNVKVNGDNL